VRSWGILGGGWVFENHPIGEKRGVADAEEVTALSFKAFGALVASGDEWEIELEAEALIEKSGAED